MHIEDILTDDLVGEILRDIQFMDHCILEVLKGPNNSEGLLGLIQEM